MSLLLLAGAFIFGGAFWLGVCPLLLTVYRCVAGAVKARVAPQFRGWRATLLISLFDLCRTIRANS